MNYNQAFLPEIGENEMKNARNVSQNQWLRIDSDPLAAAMHKAHNEYHHALMAEAELRKLSLYMAEVLKMMGLLDTTMDRAAMIVALDRANTWKFLKQIEAMNIRPLKKFEKEQLLKFKNELLSIAFPDTKEELKTMCTYPLAEDIAEHPHERALIHLAIDIYRWKRIAALDKAEILNKVLPENDDDTFIDVLFSKP
jgi:hypothetical protein